MDIDTLRKRFPDEDACRKFFEAVLCGRRQNTTGLPVDE